MKLIVVKIGIAKGDKILLVQEKKPSVYGLWNLPGGKVEDGEGFESALKREISEELDVELTDSEYIKTYNTEIEIGKLAIVLFAGKISGDITIDRDELLDFGWFSLGEIEKMAADNKIRGETGLEQTRDIFSFKNEK